MGQKAPKSYSSRSHTLQESDKHVRRSRSSRHSSSEVSLFVKYLLFFANVLFWLLGIALIGAGAWAWYERGVFDNLNQLTSVTIDPVLLLIAPGGVIFVLAFAGCIGALRENISLLRFYSVILGVIFFSEVAVGVLAYVYRDKLETQVSDTIDNIIRNYRDNVDLQDLIDFLQSYFQCCGGRTYKDWDKNLYFNCSLTKSPDACGVPFSCCRNQGMVVNTQCGYGVRNEGMDANRIVYTEGCVDVIRQWIVDNFIKIVAAIAVVLLVEIFGVCFSQSLVNDIQHQKAKWR
ncbi:tetraspanin-5-like [Antedon mediterranea]|uniref:tetraspanin-5-like n=1 Tax=Antedon mediterranea TaxID=105859 RepID=UPI003AF946EE